jgi:hypothetical protein
VPVADRARALGFKDELDGKTIFGKDFPAWAKEHHLFNAYHPATYIKLDWEQKDYDNFMRSARYWSLKEVQNYIMGYACKTGHEEHVQEWVDNMKKSAREKNVKQVRFLTGRKGPLAWAARGVMFSKDREERAGKLFNKFDLSGMALKDLPVWPLDADGNLDETLISWMKTRNATPPEKYYSAKKATLAELIEKENELKNAAPREEKPSAAGSFRQITIFDAFGAGAAAAVDSVGIELSRAEKCRAKLLAHLEEENIDLGELLRKEKIDAIEVREPVREGDPNDLSTMNVMSRGRRVLVLHPDVIEQLFKRGPPDGWKISDLIVQTARYELDLYDALHVPETFMYGAFGNYLAREPGSARNEKNFRRYIRYLRSMGGPGCR